MKKYLVILIVSAIAGAILTGCGSAAEGNNEPAAPATNGTSPEGTKTDANMPAPESK
jgi:hypothetical protein